MVCSIPKFDHITPVLIGLHWLPVRYRVIFKILLLVYKALHANVPPYISDLLTPKHIGCYSLRSNEQNLLIVPKTMRKTFGDRAFAKAGPFLWNELPADIRGASTVETFKSRLIGVPEGNIRGAERNLPDFFGFCPTSAVNFFCGTN